MTDATHLEAARELLRLILDEDVVLALGEEGDMDERRLDVERALGQVGRHGARRQEGGEEWQWLLRSALLPLEEECRDFALSERWLEGEGRLKPRVDVGGGREGR